MKANDKLSATAVAIAEEGGRQDRARQEQTQAEARVREQARVLDRISQPDLSAASQAEQFQQLLEEGMFDAD